MAIETTVHRPYRLDPDEHPSDRLRKLARVRDFASIHIRTELADADTDDEKDFILLRFAALTEFISRQDELARLQLTLEREAIS